jgi:Co/Zn/Cd efflux system component
MMIVAGCAVAFNILLGFVLHGVPHGHSHGGGGGGGHGHSHGGGDEEHLNVRAATIHVLGDLIQGRQTCRKMFSRLI